MTTFKGKDVELKGKFPTVGEKAPSFTLVGQDLKEVTLESFKGKKVILNIFISLDTSVCSKSLKTFEEKVSPEVVVANVSLDLPFAATRYCEMEKVGAVTLSAFRSSFGKDYGVEIAHGPLEGLLTRAIVVIGEDGTIIHTELVPEITNEPDYISALSV